MGFNEFKKLSKVKKSNTEALKKIAKTIKKIRRFKAYLNQMVKFSSKRQEFNEAKTCR